MDTNFRLVSKDGKALLLAEVPVNSRLHTVSGATVATFSTREAAAVAISSGGLTPYITREDRANFDLTAIYNAMSDADKATYDVLFLPVRALVTASKFEEAKTALNAVTIPDRLTATRTQMVAILDRK